MRILLARSQRGSIMKTIRKTVALAWSVFCLIGISIFSPCLFAQDYTSTIATCTVSSDTSGNMTVTCTPVYQNPFVVQQSPVNLGCPHARTWGITGNGHLLASSGTGLYTTFTISQGTTLNIHMQGTGGVACTQDNQPLSLWVGNTDPVRGPGPWITYCQSKNATQVAYGYVPDISCSFTPTAGNYNLYFGTNIGINTHTPFHLTVTP
jgi:hypothetical protein